MNTSTKTVLILRYQGQSTSMSCRPKRKLPLVCVCVFACMCKCEYLTPLFTLPPISLSTCPFGRRSPPFEYSLIKSTTILPPLPGKLKWSSGTRRATSKPARLQKMISLHYGKNVSHRIKLRKTGSSCPI